MSELVRKLIPHFESLKKRFPKGFDSSLTLPALRKVQEERGYVADEDIDALVQYLRVPRMQIEQVLSFYTQFRRKPIGRHHIEVCRNVSCSMRGSESVLRQLRNRLGIDPGQTTPDGRVTLTTCECLGSCGTAPVVVVDEAYHENMTPASLDKLLESLK